MTDPPRSDSEEDGRAGNRRRLSRKRGRSRLHKRVSRFISYCFIVTATSLLSRLPLPVARTFGRYAGIVASWVARRERRMALENLCMAFDSELDEREIRRLCRASFVHTATCLATAVVIRRWSVEKLERRFGLRTTFEEIGPVLAHGSVGITAHFGNWELLALCFARYLPGALVPIASRNANKRLQNYLERFRKSLGLDVFYTDESPRRLFGLLKEGKALGFLPDQDLKTPNGTFVDFFGRPAYTTTIPVNLARSSKRGIFFGVLVHEGRGFRLVFRPVELEWSGDRVHDLRENTRRWTALLEEEIRKRPEQWIWFHNRWRTRPGEERARKRIHWANRARRQRPSDQGP